MNIHWPKIRVSRHHRATVLRTDRHMMTAAGRHVDLFMQDERGSWVRVASTGPHPKVAPRLTAREWARVIVGGALAYAVIFGVIFLIFAVGPDSW